MCCQFILRLKNGNIIFKDILLLFFFGKTKPLKTVRVFLIYCLIIQRTRCYFHIQTNASFCWRRLDSVFWWSKNDNRPWKTLSARRLSVWSFPRGCFKKLAVKPKTLNKIMITWMKARIGSQAARMRCHPSMFVNPQHLLLFKNRFP